MKHLSFLRRIAAIAILLLFTFCFVNFTEALHSKIGAYIGASWLAHYQWVPALISMSSSLILLTIISLLFGRLYCSLLCPLGLLQDVVFYFSKRIRGKKKSRMNYEKPHTWIRFGILGVTILCYICGISLFLLVLDPYSNFGRIASNLFRPIYIGINNLLASIFNYYGNYTFYKVNITTINLLSFLFTFSLATIIGFFAWFRGRLYCNTICPVGSFLGLLSPLSIFKIKMNSEHCTHCKLCETQCKSQCINSQSGKIDYTRCVTCFDCIHSCKQGGISYGWSWKKNNKKTNNDSKIESRSRRQAIVTSGTLLFSLPFLKAEKVVDSTNLKGLKLKDQSYKEKEVDSSLLKPYKRETPIAPPGSVNFKEFTQKCTACQLCITQCPSKILKPAHLEYGLNGIMQPTMSYLSGFCNFNCTLCSDICPNGALKKMTLDEKRTTQIGIAHFIQENCIVFREETDCGACSEHCPTQAVKMVEYKNGLRIPHVTPELCVGCGGCEYICPVRPFRAIHIEGNEIQQKSQKIEKEEQKQYKIDDFGF